LLDNGSVNNLPLQATDANSTVQKLTEKKQGTIGGLLKDIFSTDAEQWKSDKDPKCFQNQRQVSVLSTTSKLFEKLILREI
jgi:hypothetical protein